MIRYIISLFIIFHGISLAAMEKLPEKPVLVTNNKKITLRTSEDFLNDQLCIENALIKKKLLAIQMQEEAIQMQKAKEEDKKLRAAEIASLHNDFGFPPYWNSETDPEPQSYFYRFFTLLNWVASQLRA